MKHYDLTVNVIIFKILINKNNIKCLFLKRNLMENQNSDTVLSHAIEAHDISAVMYLHKQMGKPLSDNFIVECALYGFLEGLKYFHENGCPWHDMTTTVIMWHGNLDCLKYAHEHGCPWYSSTTHDAAQEGYLE